ncbi:MAG: hypothetical protein AB9866_05435 [Syntrophobacteraceae bacterium]
MEQVNDQLTDLVAAALQPLNDFFSLHDGGEHAKMAELGKVLNKTALAQLDKLVDALEEHLGGTVCFNVSRDSFSFFDHVRGVKVSKSAE